MTRIYVPTTITHLRSATQTGAPLGAEGARQALAVHAVTPEMREWYTEGDLEELEYAALIDAAEASLRLLAGDLQAPRRRVVLAADVPEALVVRDPSGRWRSSVILAGGLDLGSVVSLHLDEDAARPAVGAAARAVAAADAGDDEASFTVEEAEGFDLLWYDITELSLVIEFA